MSGTPLESSIVESGPAVAEERVHGAWRAWLASLATDPEAALAAALAYQALDDAGRGHWLDALDQDVPRLEVPRVAVYAPLLAVEDDSERRIRIELALGAAAASVAREPARPRALRGTGRDRGVVIVLVLPLYLDFVHTIVCAIGLDGGFASVRHDPICRACDAPSVGARVEGLVLEATPVGPAVDELAHAVLAHRRGGRPLPAGLDSLVELLAPSVDEAG